MTLRGRIAAAAGLAVALAVLAAAVSLYAAVRSELRDEIDTSLAQRAQSLMHAPQPGGEPPPGPPPDEDAMAPHGEHGHFPQSVQPAPLGASSGYVQFLSADGAVHVPGGQGPRAMMPPTARDETIAKEGAGRALTDRSVGGTHLRVLTLGAGPGGAIMVARPLTEADRELTRLLVILAIFGAAGIALAAALGALVARAALAPIGRFVRRTEALAGELDISQRLDAKGRDELARLARSFNATLDALERALEAQRNLIADASHELRTPIASLRANVQVLEHAERLEPADQESLRADIILELDELTRLVSDIVELARGTGGDSVREQLRLDQIVGEAVERARRRGEVRFQAKLEPTTIVGESERVSRAVTNLLDNARKWSPPRGLVEVELGDGVLTVRDHGPGFGEADMPHVFERFYRASTARKLPGSGLGLAIVHQAALAHEGHARASNAPGGGAQVTVSFGPPVDAPERRRSTPGEQAGG